MASVELNALSKRFGAVEVIKDLNLTIEDGTFCALLGPSGCGKSTMLRMVAGLESVSDGEIRIGGEDVTRAEPKSRGVAMVFQSYALYPHLTVAQNITFSMSLAGESRAKQREAAERIGKMLHLDHLLDRKPSALSGGQRQRVAIGRALVRDPKVFLFDEPLSNLDALLRVQMRLELAKLHNDVKTTMIYVTHDQVEAMTLADKIVVLDKGKISQAGSPWELYNAPANKFVAGFIGSPAMNFFPATVLNSSADGLGVTLSNGQNITLPARSAAIQSGQTIEIGIRPEHFRLSSDENAIIKGRASVVEYLGNTTYAYVETEFGTMIVEAESMNGVKDGDAVGLTADLHHAHAFGSDGLALARA